MEHKFSHTLALIDRAIEDAEAKLAALRADRDELRKRTEINGKTVVSEGHTLTLREAVRTVLDLGVALKVPEIVARVGKLNVESKVSTSTVRSTLNRVHVSEGWRKTGSGRGTRWSKAKAGQTASGGQQ